MQKKISYDFFSFSTVAKKNDMNTSSKSNEYTPAEALWAIYMSQSKAMQKVFRIRLHAEEEAESRRKKWRIMPSHSPLMN